MPDARWENRAASGVGVVRWRGWRLPCLAYEAWQRGCDVLFVLEREGDLMLVPVALCGRLAAPHQPLSGDEVMPVLETLWEMIGEGWQVTGRLHTAFVGFDSEDDFWRETLQHLGVQDAHGNLWMR